MAKLNLQGGVSIEAPIEEIQQFIEAVGGSGTIEAKAEETPKYVKVRYPQEGAFVKITEEPPSFLRKKEYYKIIEVDEYDDPQIIDDDGDAYDLGCDCYEYEVYTLEKEEVEKDPEEEPLKVGDYIVALPESDGRYGITNTRMVLGKVIEDDVFNLKVLIHKDGKGVCSRYDVELSYFRKASDEEVKQALKAKEDAELAEKWKKLGRKPGEFKNGDVVRVINTGSSELKVDEIGILSEVGVIDARVNGRITTINWLELKNMELIAPVESRVDL